MADTMLITRATLSGNRTLPKCEGITDAVPLLEIRPAERRNDPAAEETERAARELCAAPEQSPDALVDGEREWRRYVEMR